MPNRALTVVLALTFTSGASSASAQVVHQGKVSGTFSPVVVPQVPGLGTFSGVGLAQTGLPANIGLTHTVLPSLSVITPVVAAKAALRTNALPAVAPTAALFAVPAAQSPAAGLSAAGAVREENYQRTAGRIAEVSKMMQQDLAAAGDEKSGGEASKTAAARLLEPSAPAAVQTEAYAPVLSPPWELTKHQKRTLEGSYAEMRSAWVREFAPLGVDFAKEQPKMKVLSSEYRLDLAKGTGEPQSADFVYDVEWSASGGRGGRIRVLLNAVEKDLRVFPGGTRQGEPLLPRIAFPAGSTLAQRALLIESLSRRKAGWTRGLERSGLKLKDGQPEVTLLSMETRVSKRNPADYTVTYQLEWKLSETKLGRMKVTVNSLKLEPYVSTLPLPTPPKERQLLVRFKTRTLESAGGLSREISIGEKEIKALAETLGLRVLWHSYKGEYALAAPAGTDMAAAEEKLLASDLVVDARPAVFEVPAENQVKLVFKKNTRYGWGDVPLPHEVDDTVVAAILRSLGVRVLSVDFGVWTVGAPKLDAVRAARYLMTTRMALYAFPAVSAAPESRQVVVKLRRTLGKTEVGEDEVADFLLKNGARIVKAMGDGYKLEVSGDNAAAAAKLAKDPLVERAAAVGALTDDSIRATANGVASYKGRPWSSTEYNAAWGYAYEGLEGSGATKAQLDLFEKLTAEAPMRGGGFNPWSGD
ncbi:MAG: hypothetical protein WC969_00555 [Elusimicrobiota bacterium]|jgi:hypothetical protein